MRPLRLPVLALAATLACGVAACSSGASAIAAVDTDVTFVFEADLAAARASGLVDASATDGSILDDLAASLRRRAEAAQGVTGVRVFRDGDATIEIHVSGALSDGRIEALGSGLALRGDLRIRIADRDAEPDRVTRFPRRWSGAPEDKPRGWEDDVPLLEPVNAAYDFTSRDFQQVSKSFDASGSPAIGFELKQERKEAFRAFTGANVERLLAIVVDGEIVSLAVIQSELPGGGVIKGRFTQAEVEVLLVALRGGPLSVPVRLIETRR